MDASSWRERVVQDPEALAILRTLHEVNGFYCTPQNQHGSWTGYLVGYAGTDAYGNHYVGDTYLDFGALENCRPGAMGGLAQKWIEIHHPFAELPAFDTLIGVPSGGIAFSFCLAGMLKKRWVLAQKKILTDGGERRGTHSFAFDRHDLHRGERCLIVEDIINNRSSATLLRQEAEKCGAQVVGEVCIWSRAPRPSPIGLPTFSIVAIPLPEWQQDDLAVACMARKKRIIWKPRANREKLSEIMRQKPPPWL